MRSRYADDFNHDDQAERYDRIVLNESEPIRAAYGQVLDWVATEAEIRATSDVVDLGSGTGNLSALLPPCARLVCVDVSAKMATIARDKLTARGDVEFVQSDLLEFLSESTARFDAIVSTYALHHLPPDEKALLFRSASNALRPRGIAVFGDLMFENPAARTEVLTAFHEAGRPDVEEAADDEFFWDVDASLAALRALGLEAIARRFSALSWGIRAVKPA